MGVSATGWAQQTSLRDATAQAQQEQAALQEKIDAADDATRELLTRLRDASREAARLERYNDELARRNKAQQALIEKRRAAIEQLSVTREALPGQLRDMVSQLRTLIKADLPFLREERLARVDSLDAMLDDSEMSAADKLDRVLSAWRTELDYGREMDTWQGRLVGDDARQVDYLRVGRIGFYYVTPNGREGGVWRAETQKWQPLEGDALDELRKGMRIARDQRAPALLDLPVSVTVETPAGDDTNASAEDKES
ncbi:uncharacterized protein DUF3450 [Chromohalobacter marismortui]|uniref:Uncharacterized protein DUF3450 n=1 Tax=Chromohalobacter marismortui TaxID=42055 RepID=A0A4R7NV75_9GAMM|nr:MULTISPECIES: DUF3450 domain-containing protein [Chromohalobacter]MCI0510359.1 DUF3450 domain-containing protein [Chromohalobacter sp.]MCI0594756.1 DUF3450 domain-containing protein [Chromohalobacter sp.]TDU25065.1 uncharacterized protein DUF3450 [Chromohalobacter marismortui]